MLHIRRPARFHFFLIPVFFVFFASCLVDIRPDAIKDRVTPTETEKARAILRKAVDSSSPSGDGLNKWLGQSGVTVKMIDEWYGLAGRVSKPWPEMAQSIRISFMPGSDDSVVELLNQDGSPTGEVWGIHDWNVWKREDGKPVYRDDANIHFTLPTVEYFLEAPFRLLEPSALIEYAGQREVGGVLYDMVYVTWGQLGTQDLVDQYLVFVNASTGRLKRIDCTVRDKMPNVAISVFYKDFRPVGDFVLPYIVDITPLADEPDSSYHIYKIDEWKLNVGLERGAYAPENRPPRSKY